MRTSSRLRFLEIGNHFKNFETLASEFFSYLIYSFRFYLQNEKKNNKRFAITVLENERVTLESASLHFKLLLFLSCFTFTIVF